MKNWNYIEGAKTGNEKAISSTFHMNDYGVEVGQWSWDWRGKAPDEKKQNEIAQKIKSYVQQINKNVPAGDSDERDEVFSKLDKFVRSQGLNKKVGNAGITDKEFNSESEMRRWCIEHNYTYSPVGGGYYRLEDDSGKNRKDLEAHVKAGNKKVGNALSRGQVLYKEGSKTYVYGGNVNGSHIVYRQPDGRAFTFSSENEINSFIKDIPAYKQAWKTGNEEKTGAEEFFKQLSDDVKEREKKDDKEIEKVGNSSVSGGTFKSDDGSQKAVIDVNPQSGTARVVWFENDRQNGSSDYRSIDLATAAVKRKGLKKVGNALVGNSASDDKFAYVMREFDAGKLKTPDGKIVTDPAQAKAIAYSESKKTENGMARARKAIK